jgi:hypothetical protein
MRKKVHEIERLINKQLEVMFGPGSSVLCAPDPAGLQATFDAALTGFESLSGDDKDLVIKDLMVNVITLSIVLNTHENALRGCSDEAA